MYVFKAATSGQGLQCATCAFKDNRALGGVGAAWMSVKDDGGSGALTVDLVGSTFLGEWVCVSCWCQEGYCLTHYRRCHSPAHVSCWRTGYLPHTQPPAQPAHRDKWSPHTSSRAGAAKDAAVCGNYTPPATNSTLLLPPGELGDCAADKLASCADYCRSDLDIPPPSSAGK